MTTPPSFPLLPGQGWSIHKKPIFSTLVASHVSGREVRAPQYQYPLWEFELTFAGLASDAASYPGLGAESLQNLMGLFLQCQGKVGTFLYADPSDSSVVGQAIATGDGVATAFVMPRTLGGFAEPVGWVTAIASVALNGVNQPAGWSLTAPNILAFVAPPSAGVAIAASFAYAFVCRFLDDVEDFEQFMANLWALQSLKFRSVRSS